MTKHQSRSGKPALRWTIAPRARPSRADEPGRAAVGGDRQLRRDVKLYLYIFAHATTAGKYLRVFSRLLLRVYLLQVQVQLCVQGRAL